MSGIMKVFLLLAVAICISKAQLNEPGQSCLCQRVRNRMSSKSDIKDIQIYPATIFCPKVEIVVTSGRGFRYCLNPELQAVKRMLTRIIKANTTAKPTSPQATSDSSSTAQM
ncbi:C-X-C motif chemokine 10-like [Fundulus diaphanus]